MKLPLRYARLSFALVAASFFLLASNVERARADWDPVLEAQEAAQRKAAADEAARRKAASDAMVRKAELDAKRKYLGAGANGLSDSQIDAAYAKKLADDQQKGLAAQKEGMAMYAEGRRKAAESQPQTDAAMKQMTGKSATELMNMSDEELEKFAADMEKKFGTAE